MVWHQTHKSGSSGARRGVLTLPHGEVETPVFMPVGTAATVKALPHRDLEEIGFSLILGNTYHLVLRPGMEVIEKAGGLHEFSGWRGNILTDSGGFQVFSLSSLRKISEEGVTFRSHIDGSSWFFTPESVVDFQTAFGSDIQMPLDVCTKYGADEEESRQAVKTTTAWLRRAKARLDPEYRGSLFGIMQGNFYKNLRATSAAEIVDLDLPGYAVGGLSVGEPPEVFVDFLQMSAELLPEEKPRYVMGIGTPEYLVAAIEAGVDMFDCVFPTRIARNGTLLTTAGRVVLKNEQYRLQTDTPADPNCGCRVCRRYSRAYMRHLFKAKEILGPVLATYHNLAYLKKFVEDARAAIASETFPAFANSVYAVWGRPGAAVG